MLEIWIRYIHFMGIITLSSALVAEHLLLAPTLSKAQIKKIAIVDMIYFIGAIVALVAGMLLWFSVGKPPEFYTKNWVFHTKLTLFFLIAIMSIVPTLFFLKHRKTELESVDVPKKIIMVIRMELTLLVFIPLLATFIAKGQGLA